MISWWSAFILLVPYVTAATNLSDFSSNWMNIPNPLEIISENSIWNPLTWLQPKLEDIPYNPDQDLTTPEIAIRHGYAAETHTVVTEDGYLLTVHRMPCGKIGCQAQGGRGRGQPILVQHGLLSSSADWLLSGPEKGLAFILADAGYDVWLGNIRGNTYSRKHVSMKNDESAFWDFSWHEMAIYDIPAQIDYVYNLRAVEQGRNETETNLIYVGHSMGTTMMFAMLTMKPEYNDRVKAMFALAPVAFMTNVKSPIRLLAPFSNDLEFIMKIFGANEFLPQNRVLRFLSKYGCELTDAEKFICENLIFVICGFDKQEYNATLVPVVFAHTPAGTSTKTVLHFAQEIHEHGNFQQFDYGEAKNMKKYGQPKPPLYNLENIRVPIAYFWAQNDWLAGPKDVQQLYSKLNNTAIGSFKIQLTDFNHIDFLWGIDAPALVYEPMLRLIRNFGK